ncbi:hypothetical protein FHR88_002516 [Bradyrhizobium betae]|nr:hypothetical protein [Bradyrhizobium betae]
MSGVPSSSYRIHLSCPGRAATLLALLRGAGTQQATQRADGWTPALQRITPDDASHRRERCAASGARDCGIGLICFRIVIASAAKIFPPRQCPFRHPEVRVARCQASRREPRRMSGRDAAGPSPFEARRRGEHLRMTVMDWCSRHVRHLVFDRRHSSAFSRRVSPELCFISTPSNERAQGRPGAGRAPAVHCAKGGNKNLHSGIQVKPNIRPFLRSGFTAYVALSPGSDALLPPSPCG